MYCKECGEIIEDESKFCKHCGTPTALVSNNQSGTSIVPTEIKSQSTIVKNNIYCPKYNHSDYIAKVSSIYSSGVSTGSYSGTAVSFITPFSSNESSSIAVTPVSMSGINITDLSRRIAPPPVPPPLTKLWLIVFIILTFLTGPFALVFIPLSIWQGIRIRNKNREIEAYMPTHKRAVESWNKLYYCGRDDIVFNPETSEFSTPEKIYDLILNDMRLNNPTIAYIYY